MGTWGGDGIHLTIDFQGAEVRYNCAFGTMDEPIIPDETGRLEVDGTYVVEVGPCCGNPRPARHDGTISGAGMVLTRTLLDTGESETFSLVFGDDGRVEFCY